MGGGQEPTDTGERYPCATDPSAQPVDAARSAGADQIGHRAHGNHQAEDGVHEVDGTA